MNALTFATAALIALPIAAAAQTQPPPKPSAPTPTPSQPPIQTPAPAPTKPATQSRTSLELTVTSQVGDPLEGTSVTATGPVARSGVTDGKGVILFRSLPPGLYRLRLTGPGWTTLERDVNVRGSAVIRIDAALTPAETPPAPPPAPEPVPAPAAPPPPSSANVEPRTVIIPDFIDQNFLGRAPRKDSVIGCTPTSTTTLIQLREPMAEHSHAAGDEILYVVAGEAMHKVAGRETKIEAGSYSLVPRGVPHSLTRRGSNPIVLLAIETGSPCTGG
jgi:hypothetical protein